MLDLLNKDFISTILNIVKELWDTTSKEPKKSMKITSYQIEISTKR